MKNWTKKVIGITAVAAVSFGFISFSCKANRGSANVAFAETTPSVSIPTESLSVVEALQTSFRSISSQLLPAVVEVDVTEKTKVKTRNPFDDFPFFFGMPKGDKNDEDNYREYTQQGLGSGVIVRKTGKTVYVLTNNHVAGKASEIKIKLNDEREFDGKLVGADERIDIALVSFETEDENITVDVSFIDDLEAFNALRGKRCILKLRTGKTIVCAVTDLTTFNRNFYTAHELRLRAIHYNTEVRL